MLADPGKCNGNLLTPSPQAQLSPLLLSLETVDTWREPCLASPPCLPAASSLLQLWARDTQGRDREEGGLSTASWQSVGDTGTVSVT